ncbi:MAG TPA: dihydropteroate synthase [Roseiflexaceae bacterium]|nr:dihydropteroate synthase [Roseiflexaceae bacterium]
MEHHHNTRFLALDAPADLEAEIRTIESYGEAVPRVLRKASHRLVRVERLPAVAAMILKQELLALDGDALISPAVYLGDRDTTTDALLFATLRQLHDLVRRLGALGSHGEPPLRALGALAAELTSLLEADAPAGRGALDLAGRQLKWGARTYVMGIINVTPDSFSTDGLAQPAVDLAAAALERARACAAEGADLLDVGGESTRPGAQPIGLDEELRRVVPAVAAIAAEVNLPISVDTYHAEVAAAALDAGAHMINDVWGLRTPEGNWNTALADLAAARDTPIVLMHNRRAPPSAGAIGGHYRAVEYHDLLGEIIGELRERVIYAIGRGIRRERIVVDPGLGFGKTPEQNLVLLRRLAELRSLGLPLLVGASRKSFVGLALGLPPTERDEGTAATTALAIRSGADVVRVHNVRVNVRAARVADAVVRYH